MKISLKMNSINDELPRKTLKDGQITVGLKNSRELSHKTTESFKNSKRRENVDKNEQKEGGEGNCDSKAELSNPLGIENDDNMRANNMEFKTKHNNKNISMQNKQDSENIEIVNQKIDHKNIEEINKKTHNTSNEQNYKRDETKLEEENDNVNKRKSGNESHNTNAKELMEQNCDENSELLKEHSQDESVTKETILDEDAEDYEDIEDVEIPEEEEVDEIIVPDEAEAEDLTDEKDIELFNKQSSHDDVENGGKDNKNFNGKDHHEDIDDLENEDFDNKSMEDDEEEAITKISDIEGNEINDDATSKSSEVIEKDEDSDKKSLNSDTKEDTSSKGYEESDAENQSNEPELITLDDDNSDIESEESKNVDSPLTESKSNEPHIDEDTTSQVTYDPLNCTVDKVQVANDKEGAKNENSLDSRKFEEEKYDTTYDSEDDEVQFVETRNSPICIESDEDETNTELPVTSNNNNKRIIAIETSTVTASKNTTITRTSARKSTAKPQLKQMPCAKQSPNTTPRVENIPKNFNYSQKATVYNNRSFTGASTQQIIDCIELLDSSDEESKNTPNRYSEQKRTPQKRTLLAAKGNYYKNSNTNKLLSIIVPNRLPHNFSPQVRQQPKKPLPPPLPPPTPQSNFLNAVQLQPAQMSGSNPPAFSALLSNKNVIIPNAFYGNPPNVRNPDIEIERRYIRWLENFLSQFCKPQFVATHSCLVFLQRALKYKDFVRIKTLRTSLNNEAQSGNNQLNMELMTDLKGIFLKNSRKITNYGQRFCELTCSALPGKTVALMAHCITNKVSLKTCSMELPKSINSATSSASSPSNPGTNTLTRKRQLDEDEDEYTPDKSIFKTKGKSSSENGDEDSCDVTDDRKRSLRTKRTKRLDNSFSYNEDDLLPEYEIEDEEDEKLAQVVIQRKIEKKRLEAQEQRQQQVKSFESAFIQAFAKTLDGPSSSTKTSKNSTTQRVKLKNTTTETATSVRQYTANNDAEDLLQATWIETVENDETQIISDDDEPKEHRIYKQQQQQTNDDEDYYASSVKLSNNKKRNLRPPRRTQEEIFTVRASKRKDDEVITGDDYDESNYYVTKNDDALHWPKNIDTQMYVNGKYKDKCVICNLSCQRLVHHYVNEHRGCEVYNSRLSLAQIRFIKRGHCTVSNITLYKNGQFQYEAFCIFCQKTSRFMFPYWYQHFTMHTGEYAYRCLGCGIRKPTRSLLTQHQAQGCPEAGGVAQDYAHDSKSLQIEGKICNICNYIQLHRASIVKHLHTQHNITQILPKHIQTIVLLKTPANMAASSLVCAGATPSKRLSNLQSSAHLSNTNTSYVIDDDEDDNESENDMAYAEIMEEESESQQHGVNNYYNYIPPYMQAAINSGNFSFDDVESGEDLSYVISGMLDVQMNADEN